MSCIIVKCYDIQSQLFHVILKSIYVSVEVRHLSLYPFDLNEPYVP
jgi:hypothetical protein